MFQHVFFIATGMAVQAMKMQRQGGVKRQAMKARAAPGWKKLSGEEARLAKEWHADESLTPNKIAERLGRDKFKIFKMNVVKVLLLDGRFKGAILNNMIFKP